MPFQFGPLDPRALGKFNFYDVLPAMGAGLRPTARDAEYICAVAQNPLTNQEAGSKIPVMTGSAHGDGNAFFTRTGFVTENHPDFQRFFDRDAVIDRQGMVAFPACDPGFYRLHSEL